jgi:hypothetical protein
MTRDQPAPLLVFEPTCLFPRRRRGQVGVKRQCGADGTPFASPVGRFIEKEKNHAWLGNNFFGNRHHRRDYRLHRGGGDGGMGRTGLRRRVPRPVSDQPHCRSANAGRLTIGAGAAAAQLASDGPRQPVAILHTATGGPNAENRLRSLESSGRTLCRRTVRILPPGSRQAVSRVPAVRPV